MTNNETAAKPTALAPYRATEETALRYSNSLTILNLTGTAPNGESYSLIVSAHGKTSFWVTWNVRQLELPSITRTCRNAYWGKNMTARFRTQAAALDFAKGKLETLRAWADQAKRAA